ncbi:MAG: regulatory protein RecX [Bacteroidia bacterium]
MAAKRSDKSPLEKLKHYCAWQERCHSEVKAKLEQLKVPWQEHDAIIAALIAENFLNEERFSRLFARSKMHQKQWGKQKIVQALKAKRVSDYCIRMALKELESEDYAQALEIAARRKWQQLAAESPFSRRNKLARYLMAKGFESEQLWAVVHTLEAGEAGV